MRPHAAGIAIALVLALVIVAPRWWSLAAAADEGARVPVSPYGAGAIGYDESLYTVSIRDAYDGELPLRDPYLVNHQDGAPQRSSLPHSVIGVLGRVTGGPFNALALVTTACAIAALLLLYALNVQLTRSRYAAAVLLPVIVVAIEVLNRADGILPLREAHIWEPLLMLDPEEQFHAWSRFPAPILVLAPFFALVIALPKAVENGARRWMIASVVLVAALIYAYVYYWTALGLALAMWLAVLWLRGQRVEARRLAIIGALAVLLALPEFGVIGWSAVSLPADARDRVGLRSPGIDVSEASVVLQRLLVGAPFIFALLRQPRLAPARNWLYLALFCAPLVLTVVEGLVPQEWHYQTQVWGVFSIPTFVAGGAAIWSWIGERDMRVPRAAYVVTGALAACALVYAVALQSRAIAITDEGYVVTDDEDAAFAWMRSHLDEDDTVVSPSITTNLLLASLTPSSQYLADGGFTHADDDELIARMLRVQAAYGYSDDDVMRRLSIDGEHEGFPLHEPTRDEREQERLLENYLAFFVFSFEIEDRAWFKERTASFAAPYEALLSTDDPLSAYPAEYLFCGHRERYFKADAPAPGTYVRVAFERGDVAVYERVARDAAGAMPFEGCRAS
ncbi:MAG TPA: hypothetical protein VFH62_07195 [Dehalococcoidia bacterium]|nr:hypothetical protein [Dehalococcoidia bacterium]